MLAYLERRFAVLRLPIAVLRRYQADAGDQIAASMTYFIFLSLFPLVAGAVAVLGYTLVDDPDRQAELAARAVDFLPGLGRLVGDNLEAIVARRGTAAGLAVAGLVWSGLGVAGAMSTGLNRVFNAPSRGAVRRRLTGLAWLGFVGAMLAAGSALTAGLAAAGDLLPLRSPAVRVGMAGVAFTAGAGVDFVTFWLTYRLMPNVRVPWRPAAAGAALVTVAWQALKLAGGWYGSRVVAGSSAVFGSLAGVVGLLALVYLASRVFLYGAELTDELRSRHVRSEPDGNGARDVHPLDRLRLKRVSTSEIVRMVADDTRMLVRKEMELARQETMDAVTTKLKGAGMIAAAVAAVLPGVLFLLVSLALWLPWNGAAGFAVVGAGAIVLGLIPALIGLRLLKASRASPRVVIDSIKEDVRWARRQLTR